MRLDKEAASRRERAERKRAALRFQREFAAQKKLTPSLSTRADRTVCHGVDLTAIANSLKTRASHIRATNLDCRDARRVVRRWPRLDARDPEDVVAVGMRCKTTLTDGGYLPGYGQSVNETVSCMRARGSVDFSVDGL